MRPSLFPHSAQHRIGSSSLVSAITVNVSLRHFTHDSVRTPGRRRGAAAACLGRLTSRGWLSAPNFP
jgi:hypothetical protein